MIRCYSRLKGQTPEQVLPAIVAGLAGARLAVVVQGSSEERIEALDAHLWMWRDGSFCRTGPGAMRKEPAQPILLTPHDGNPQQRPAVRFLVEGAAMPPDPGTYGRSCWLFDGDDADAVETRANPLDRGEIRGFEVRTLSAGGRKRRRGGDAKSRVTHSPSKLCRNY